MKPLGLGKSCRLNLDRQVQDLLRNGQRASGAGLTLCWDRQAHQTQQLGIRISSRLAGAAQRNRVKRLLREIFRLHRAQWLENLRLLIIVKSYEPAAWKSFFTMEAAVLEICSQNGLKR